ncbi:MAG: hypothetical protein PWR10_507 [Halanaerobiales bacterium]|nr:hypothetical protein [Halanaerobiales bacterium]
MSEKTIKLLNTIILSMAAKQEVLDKLESKVFNVDIYRQYINSLMIANLELMDLKNSRHKYKNLINKYLNGKIDDPDEIITHLKAK